MPNKNNLAMEYAKEESNKSSGNWQLGAAIVKKNRLLSKAHNLDKTPPCVWIREIYESSC